MEIKITHSARLDLLEIKSYLKENFPDAVKPTLLKLQEYIEQLVLFPQSGVESSVKEVKELKTSKLPYVIVYSVNGNVLEILRIYHTSRKPILHWR